MNILINLFLTVLLTSNLVSSHLITPSSPSNQPNNNTPVTMIAASSSDITSKVQQLSTQAPQLNRNVLKLALTAYQNADRKGNVKRPVLTVIDYSLPSNKERMWIFDVRNDHLLYNTYVAHGKNSGVNRASHFSNRESSKESSLGTYITEDTYMGHKGYSLNLKGMDKGFNDNAYNRRVVIHGAWYMEPDFIRRAGRAGLSWGCPAIAQTMAKPVINAIKNGSVVFAYFPDQYFLSHSGYLVA